MIPAALRASLAAFDEAALTLLANKGAVRRALIDVEQGKVAVSRMDGDVAVVAGRRCGGAA